MHQEDLPALDAASVLDSTCCRVWSSFPRECSPAMCTANNTKVFQLLQDVKRLVRERFPAMISAETSSLHKGVAGAKHSFVTLKGTEDKLATLVQVRPEPFVGALRHVHLCLHRHKDQTSCLFSAVSRTLKQVLKGTSGRSGL